MATPALTWQQFGSLVKELHQQPMSASLRKVGQGFRLVTSESRSTATFEVPHTSDFLAAVAHEQDRLNGIPLVRRMDGSTSWTAISNVLERHLTDWQRN